MSTKIRYLGLLLCLVQLVLLFTVAVSADMGPKPSVRITFANLGDEICWATLLSKEKSTGPASVWDGNEGTAMHNGNAYYANWNLDYETWKAFAYYEDPDGYYFLQHAWQIHETKELAWTYYPPESFKILLYFPQSGRFVTSGIYESYAFHSYFTADLSGSALAVSRSYDYSAEIISLLARIWATILIEMGIALLFGFRGKKALLTLTLVNVITQVFLNAALSAVEYKSGYFAFAAYYIFFELIVFVTEAVLYCILRKHTAVPDTQPRSIPFCIVYALIANAVSFITGLVTAHVLPGIF